MKKTGPSLRQPLALQPAQAQSRTMADMRHNATIKCLYCNEQKPQTGSQKFRAHHVCCECVTKLQTKDVKL